jgi:pimeloyl-ACP methyl ester carboxylesterase
MVIQATILLIGGAGGPMEWWEPDFCRQLAGGGRYVIRYDMRDTGQSVTYPPGQPGYTGEDLASDAAGVLDALGVRIAHLVGISMGGALAQRIAAEQPDRVESLVLLSTTIALPGDGPDRKQLPGMSDDLRAYFADPPAEPDWADPAAVTAYLIDFDRRLSGPEFFDEAHTRAIVEQIVRRSTDMHAGTTNHWQIEDGAPPRPGMAAIDAPTLVIHGTVDPVFRYPQHPDALVREIRDATLLPLPGVGHQVSPPKVWPTVIPAILKHTEPRR